MSDVEHEFVRLAESFAESVTREASVSLAAEAMEDLALAVGAWGVEDPTAAQHWAGLACQRLMLIREVESRHATFREELHRIPEARWEDDGGNHHG